MFNHKELKVVIPMAGRGQRFVEEGYLLPKPLIDVCGQPMVWWAMQSLPWVPPENMIFIVSEDHIRSHQIDDRLKEIFSSDVCIFSQEGLPQGQADTVLRAKVRIDDETPLIIFNCDTYVADARRLMEEALIRHPDVDGFIPVFNSEDTGLSYVKVGSDGNIVEVAEKKVISFHATIGMYHFRKGKDFVWAACKMIAENHRVNDEFYVLPVYEYLVAAGLKYRMLEVPAVHVLGTPQGMKDFLNLQQRIGF